LNIFSGFRLAFFAGTKPIPVYRHLLQNQPVKSAFYATSGWADARRKTTDGHK
jgi:hypothetical protein